MIVRSELKWATRAGNVHEILRHLSSIGARPLYRARRIFSVYYDTLDFTNYRKGEEGTVPRHKLRVRWYGHLHGYRDDANYEFKVTGTDGRFKYTGAVSKGLEDAPPEFRNVADQIRQKRMVPLTLVHYVRRYFQGAAGMRFTLDQDITYAQTHHFDTQSLVVGARHRDDWLAFELKTPNEKEFLDFGNEFPFSRSRFSKYARSIEFTKLAHGRD